MGKYLGFQSSQCKDCYSCLRTCPVKAITFMDGKANIVDSMCILCGACIHICPQNAKYIISNKETVVNLLKNNPGNVVISVAPSFIGNFNLTNFAQMNDAAKKLGFLSAEETANGAYYVTKEYEKIVESGKYKNLITTACPSVVEMIQKYYPDCTQYLIPVDSPAIAHSKLLRQQYGENVKLVFLGPCLAKEKELLERKYFDGVLNFEEFISLMEENNVEFDLSIEETEDQFNPARYYSINRGIVKSLAKLEKKWEYLGCDGAQQCRMLLDGIHDIENTFIEMNMCEFGCVNGPVNINKKGPAYATRQVRRFTKDVTGAKKEFPEVDIDFSHEYRRKPVPTKVPTEEEIRAILAKIGKFEKKDELNCKACGYDSCRDKAIAVYNGMMDESFCLPYMKNLAESTSNEIITHSPNGILAYDKNLRIISMNKSMMSYLALNADVSGQPLDLYLQIPELEEAIKENKAFHDIITFIPETQMYLGCTISTVEEHSLAFAIFHDLTQQITQEESLKAMRENMIKLTDDVINKQMRVVQEIASLLGETTAETKIALVKFRETLKEKK